MEPVCCFEIIDTKYYKSN